MSWFACLIALTLAADVFTGISHPARSFAIFPYLVVAALLWIAMEWRREHKLAINGRREP